MSFPRLSSPSHSRNRLRALTCSLLVLASWVQGWAEQATLVGDAHVSSSRPTVNSGSLSNLNVGGGFTALVQFDLGTLPAGTTALQVARATLRLYCNRADTPGTVSVQTVNSTWTESTVTFNTLPATGSTLTSASVSAVDQFVTFDVTTAVQSWVSAPASNFGLALTSASAVVQFDSKENDQTSHAPQLEIALAAGGSSVAGVAGATGATGAAGNTGATGTAGPQGVPGLIGPAGAAGLPGATGIAGLIGVTGATGPQGLPGNGLAGATGAVGATGATGAAGLPGLVYQGPYSSTSNYALGDVVIFAGSSWVSLTPSNHGNTPGQSPASWGPLTSQGETGIGVAGATGPTGALGPQGLQGSVGPAGEKGDQGAQGIAGQAGAQGIPGIVGATGVQGPAGPQGVVGATGLSFQGAYSAATNYALGDGVLWQGAGWVSLIAGNHGNTPDQSPTAWAMFAASGALGAAGATGTTGAAGANGAAGLPGVAGATGVTGATGAAGAAGLAYRGVYDSTANYALGDVSVFDGSSYASLTNANHGNTPGLSPGSWGLLTAQGSAGPAGLTGATGLAGLQGVVGPAGAQGNAGIQGATGPQGPAGAQGVTGAAGAVGAQGLQGAQGIAGQAGAQGLSGVTGPTGVAGPAGAQGVAGATGLTFRGLYDATVNYALADGVLWQGAGWVSLIAGNHGNTPDQSPAAWTMFAAAGAAGLAGQTGATGAPGSNGSAGAAGAAGATGLAGATGATGTPGLVYRGSYQSGANYGLGDVIVFGGSSYASLLAFNLGNTPDQNPSAWGVLTAQGATGSAGVAGPMGAAGPIGSTGPQGFAGAQGVQGPQGATGVQGPAGQQGLTGAAGAVGAAGPSGAQGIAGQAGAQGLPGATGATGLQGPAGIQGVAGGTGTSGSAGATGATGSPGLAYQGTYSSTTNYGLGDVVLYGGSSYASLNASNHGNTPDQSPTTWGLLTAQGLTGATGAIGLQGPAGPQGSIGATGVAGQQGLQGAQGIPGQAGAQGIAGVAGATGAQGPAGAAGATGLAGAAGASGATGATGSAGFSYRGTYDAAANYALGDVVLFAGSSYTSLLDSNHGNTPDVSAAAWGVLTAQGPTGLTGATGSQGSTGAQGPVGLTGAQGPAGIVGATGPQGPAGSQGIQGTAGAAGPQGAQGAQGVAGQAGAQGVAGPAGATGSQGPAGQQGIAGLQGSTGVTGAAGAVGLNFRNAWNTSNNYAVNDAVTYSGSTYLAQAANTNQEPDNAPQFWTVLAQAGGAGPTGPAGTAGAAATVTVGTVTTLPAGSQVSVTNSGSAQAAVLNFSIPQGAAGSGSSSGTTTSSGNFAAIYHPVDYNSFFYSVTAATGSMSESGSVLAWVPRGCTAVRLDVYSQQSGNILVTPRSGTPGSMADTALSCSPATSGSCPATGSVTIPAGNFVDLHITGASGTTAGVWTALECN